jgi:nucleoside-diphosphate-sugar epimerase
MKTWDDLMRKEWGWKPEYTTLDQLVSDFIQEMKTHPSSND